MLGNTLHQRARLQDRQLVMDVPPSHLTHPDSDILRQSCLTVGRNALITYMFDALIDS